MCTRGGCGAEPRVADTDRTDDWQESLVRGVRRFYAWTDKRRLTRWPMKALTVGAYVWMAWLIYRSPLLRYVMGAFLVFVIGAHLWYRWRDERPAHDERKSQTFHEASKGD
jgi:hypothetical protein